MGKSDISIVIEGKREGKDFLLQYYETKLFVPQNANLLRIGKFKYKLYGVHGYGSYTPDETPYQQGKGWPLHEDNNSLRNIFKEPRSIITGDNRVYIRKKYTSGRYWYFDALDTVVETAMLLFEGKKTVSEINAENQRAPFK